ncbi:hypothetical protein ACLOJK_016723 [Asimina triloba]
MDGLYFPSSNPPHLFQKAHADDGLAHWTNTSKILIKTGPESLLGPFSIRLAWPHMDDLVSTTRQPFPFRSLMLKISEFRCLRLQGSRIVIRTLNLPRCPASRLLPVTFLAPPWSRELLELSESQSGYKSRDFNSKCDEGKNGS